MPSFEYTSSSPETGKYFVQKIEIYQLDGDQKPVIRLHYDPAIERHRGRLDEVDHLHIALSGWRDGAGKSPFDLKVNLPGRGQHHLTGEPDVSYNHPSPGMEIRPMDKISFISVIKGLGKLEPFGGKALVDPQVAQDIVNEWGERLGLGDVDQIPASEPLAGAAIPHTSRPRHLRRAKK